MLGKQPVITYIASESGKPGSEFVSFCKDNIPESLSESQQRGNVEPVMLHSKA